jgi:beta-glucosidase
MSAASFPKGFLWGAATSSHQVEGGNDLNDWWDWEQQPGRIRDGTTSGDAAGWWAGRAEEDLARAAEMGQNAHRLSLEWSRLEPEPGTWSDEAFKRYAVILGTCRDLGLTTMVTLNHFTLPRWAAEQGSWMNPELPDRLARLGAECARRLRSLTDLWCTINEPNVVGVAAYGSDIFPPGLNRNIAAFKVMRRQIEAHALTYRAVHEEIPDARVGLVLNMPRFTPHRPGHPLDRFAAWAQDWAFSEVFVRAVSTGRLLPPLVAVPRPVEGLEGSSDFFGLNFYGRYAVRFALRGERPLGEHVQEPSIKTEGNDWGQPHPDGFREQLLRLSRSLDVPLYVTENGVYDNTDEVRPDYLVSHVRAVAEAIAAGADVRGYFHWSLVDNFEWAEGWSTRFGLLALDRETQERTPRASAGIYERICRTNGIPEDL